MDRFVLDTNVYIHAIRSAVGRRELAAFQRAHAPRIHQHAVVAAELLAGAADEATYERWHAHWLRPAERVGRVITPGYGEWCSAARVVVRLFEGRHIATRSVAPGFLHDCLLAAGAVTHDYSVITYNVRDFDLIARVLPGLKYAPPFP